MNTQSPVGDSDTLEAYRGLPVDKRPRFPTLLETWLKKHGWDMGSFARRIGVNKKMVTYWAHGKCVPNLIHAYMIEKLTKGEVFVASWLSTEVGKLLWNQLNMKADATARKGKARPSRLRTQSESVELPALQDLPSEEPSSSESSSIPSEVETNQTIEVIDGRTDSMP